MRVDDHKWHSPWVKATASEVSCSSSACKPFFRMPITSLRLAPSSAKHKSSRHGGLTRAQKLTPLFELLVTPDGIALLVYFQLLLQNFIVHRLDQVVHLLSTSLFVLAFFGCLALRQLLWSDTSAAVRATFSLLQSTTQLLFPR